MRKLMLMCFMLFPFLAGAQSVPVTLEWDASPSPGVTYRVYRSNDAAFTTPTTYDVTGLTFATTVTIGQHYFQVRAVGTCIQGDNGQSVPCESPPANVQFNPTATVLRLTVQIPPGNPGNYHIKTN